MGVGWVRVVGRLLLPSYPCRMMGQEWVGWYARYVVVYVVTTTNTTCRSEEATKEKEKQLRSLNKSRHKADR